MSTLTTLIDRLLQQPAATGHLGNRRHRWFWSSERYIVDFAEDFNALGWQQFDTSQDAWYYGLWLNPTTFQLLTYAEGDWSLTVCDGPAAYNREVKDAIAFHEEGFMLKTIDGDGTLTIYRQDRSQFLLPETPEAGGESCAR